MMGPHPLEEQEDSHLYTSKEEMDNLVLNDVVDDNNPQPSSNGGYHSPPAPPEISTTTVDDDPLSRSPQNSSFHSFLDDPLSHSDAVFPSFDLGSEDEIDGHDRQSFEGPTSSSEAEYLHISVSDPQKVPETSNSIMPGSNWYYTYLITTRTNLPEFESKEFSVRRRFREVVTLSDRLGEVFRGYFIPLRPDKSVMESQMMLKSEFVEQRRVAVEKYLRKLAAHPVIRKSDELRVFLQVEGQLPLPRTTESVINGVAKLPGQIMGTGEPALTPQEVVQPAKGGRDLFRLFKELRQTVSNDWVGTKPPVVEEDKEFLVKKEKLGELEKQLLSVSEQAEALLKAQQDIGKTMGELGLAFLKLTKFEIKEAVYECQKTRAVDMKTMATASVKASRLYRELNAQTVKHLDKLHDHLGMMLSVDNAFTDRSNALLTVQTLVSEVSSLQSRVDKLELAASKTFGGDRSRMRKIEELKETLKVTEDARCCAAREYERIKENNRSELARLDSERRADFLSMLKGFVVNQAGYAEKIANVWEKAAEETSGYAKQ